VTSVLSALRQAGRRSLDLRTALAT